MTTRTVLIVDDDGPVREAFRELVELMVDAELERGRKSAPATRT